MAGHPQRFSTLDGLRGIAALAVMLFHAGLALDRPWIVGHGTLAVDVFFAMSGFVVDRAYGARLRAGWPRGNVATARFLRLYPLYLGGTLLGLALHLFQSARQGWPIDAGGLAVVTLYGVLLAPLFRGGDRQVFPLDPPCWSLLVEIVMNVGLVAVPRWRPRAVAAGVAAAAAVLLTAGVSGSPLLHGGMSASLWIDVARGAYGFGCGLLLSRAESRGSLAPLRARWTAPVALVLLGAMLVPPGPADIWFDPPAVLLCPAIVAWACAQAQPSGRMRRVFAQVGAVSYPLYVLHGPLLKMAADLTPQTGGTPPSARAAAVGIALMLSVVLAAAAARWLEPALLRGSRRVGAPGGRPVLATEAAS